MISDLSIWSAYYMRPKPHYKKPSKSTTIKIVILNITPMKREILKGER